MAIMVMCGYIVDRNLVIPMTMERFIMSAVLPLPCGFAT